MSTTQSGGPSGHPIELKNGVLHVPHDPIIPFIEGDGTGPDIWRASVRVLDAAVEKAYGGERKIAWHEVYAGEKAFQKFNNWLPDQTIEDLRTEMNHQDVREVRTSLKVGDEVELTEGPMRGFKGIVDSLHKGQDRVRVLLEFLGRQSLVEVEAGTILNELQPRSALRMS